MSLDFKKDKTLGYMYCYCPGHPMANGAGKVYEHTYVMCTSIGRILLPNECVHHIDRDRTNNDLSNLRLMTQSEHRKLHLVEDMGVVYITNECLTCGTHIHTTASEGKIFCDNTCRGISSRKFSPSEEELTTLLWKYPMTKLAERWGVSDRAIAKRADKLNIKRPPLGYFLRK